MHPTKDNNQARSISYRSEHSVRNRVARLSWAFVWCMLVQPAPRQWRWWSGFWLRLFGAQIAKGASVSPTCRVWAPWNLQMSRGSSLSEFVNCYNVAPIALGERAIVSAYAHLCTASHDISTEDFRLITSPIVLERRTWVGMAAFVGRGVTIGEGAVVGAAAGVFKSVSPWHIVGGNPAKQIGVRQLREAQSRKGREGEA